MIPSFNSEAPLENIKKKLLRFKKILKLNFGSNKPERSIHQNRISFSTESVSRKKKSLRSEM